MIFSGAVALLVLSSLIVVRDLAKDRSLGKEISRCGLLVDKWVNRISWEDMSDSKIGILEHELENQGFKVIELQIADSSNHEILAEKSSGRKKLSAWLPFEHKEGALFWKSYFYEGAEGQFEVVQFRYPLKDRIEIVGLLKVRE